MVGEALPQMPVPNERGERKHCRVEEKRPRPRSKKSANSLSTLGKRPSPVWANRSRCVTSWQSGRAGASVVHTVLSIASSALAARSCAKSRRRVGIANGRYHLSGGLRAALGADFRQMPVPDFNPWVGCGNLNRGPFAPAGRAVEVEISSFCPVCRKPEKVSA